MKHLRTDWSAIQDIRQLIPLEIIEILQSESRSSILPDEPVFVLRAKDPCAPATVRRGATDAESRGSDPASCERVRRYADEMEAYAAEHFAGQQHAPDAPEYLP